MHLLFLTFGNKTAVHTQTSFSVYSFLTATSIRSINIITDAPHFYRHLTGRVNVISISKADLQNWQGSQQFFWRVKLKAIEKICELYPGEPVMYLDSDTFLTGATAILTNALQQGKALMHEDEGPLSAKRSKTEKRMWQQLKNRSFGGLQMQPADRMWNAGVVATPNTRQAAECTLALSVCDEMCQQGVTRRLIEQYALSLALEHTYGLAEAKQVVAHYWPVKELWNKRISDFFLEAYFSEQPPEQIIQQFDLHIFESIPIAQHTKNTNTRIKQWADRFFPPEKQVYFTKP